MLTPYNPGTSSGSITRFGYSTFDFILHCMKLPCISSSSASRSQCSVPSLCSAPSSAWCTASIGLFFLGRPSFVCCNDVQAHFCSARIYAAAWLQNATCSPFKSNLALARLQFRFVDLSTHVTFAWSDGGGILPDFPRTLTF